MQSDMTRKVTITLLLALVCFACTIRGSSVREAPLKRISHISDVRIDRANPRSYDDHLIQRRSPEEISHSDSLRLMFRAYEHTFHLHLQPTENLIPPQGASIRYTSHDEETGADKVIRTEVLYPEDIRAYRGVVMHPDYSHRRLAEDRIGLRRDLSGNSETDDAIMGDASILLHDDGSESGQPSFEGTFTWAGNQHTIQLPTNYETGRSQHDPRIHKRAINKGTLVIHRRSDRMSHEEAVALGIRAADDSSSCSTDKSEYNAQNALVMPNAEEFQSFSPLSFFALPQREKLGRRSFFPNLYNNGMGDLFSRSTKHTHAPRLESHYSYQEGLLVKRQGADALGGSNNDSFTSAIGSTSGCPSSNQVVYMGVATDCTYTGRFANDSAARVQVLNDMNTVSNIYRNTFKVSLGVVELDIRSASNCPTTAQGNARWNQGCSDGYTLDQRLSDFSSWRASQPANGTGLWHLLTTCLSGSEVGVAWLGTLCKTDASGSGNNVVSGTGVTAATENEAQTIAHEIGHNFGAVHDCVNGCSLSGNSARQSASLGSAVCCPQSSSSCNSNAQYIMSPVSARSTSQFSPCSVGNICTMLGRGLNTACVEDPTQNPRETLSVRQCGNGILEPGEECDAGPNGSNCCTSQCRLTSGSVCDPESTTCCTNSCQFAPSTQVCRPSVDSRCDTAEMCTGNSSSCPTDIRKDNGDSCGNGLQCAAGHCTSRDLQCQQQSQADYNFTEACSVTADNSCSVSCVDPSQRNVCQVLQQNFIDGTECGYGGFCQGGECKTGSWQSVFDSWYRNNLRISIPVTIIIGIIALLILYALLRCLCLPLVARARGKPVPGAMGPMAANNRNKRGNRNSAMRQSTQFGLAPGPSQYSQPQAYPPMTHDYPSNYAGTYPDAPAVPPRPQGAWVDPYSYNGSNSNSYPTHR